MDTDYSAKTEAVKKQALKDAEYWIALAQEQNDWRYYERAGQYYYTAGMNGQANHCWGKADELRKIHNSGIKLDV